MVYRWFYGLLAGLMFAQSVQAGGSGLNVLVVANQNSSNSLELANYYAEKRGVPPQNMLRINWPGARTQWTYADFSSCLLEPLRAMLLSRPLTNQAEFLVLSMDIPYSTALGTSVNSTTSALYYGFKTNGPAPGADIPASCSLPAASSNAFAGRESPFRSLPPGSLDFTNLMTTMITASNLAMAKLIVDQGSVSDESFPTQTVWLAKGPDYDRNVRYWQYDNTIFNTRLLGNYSIRRTTAIGPGGLGNILGFQSGAYNYGTGNAWFVPGALADNLTSFGGQILQDNGAQLNLLALLAAGASGSYGTVVEPCAYLEKFPSPQVYFYQARGFALAECYYQSLTNPYQGLLVGEPLAAPFARRGQGAWSTASGAILHGTTNLTVSFSAADARQPLQQVDLFIDGRWARTLTNIPPAPGNVLQATVNGRTITYTVPPNATIQSVAEGWAAAFFPLRNQTKVVAEAHGDRIELQYTDFSTAGPLPLTVQSLVGSAPTLTTRARAAQPAFLESAAAGIRAFTVTGTPGAGSVLGLTVSRTNSTQVTIGVTNNSSLTLYDMGQQLMNAISSSPLLGLAPEGARMTDLVNRSTATNSQKVEFNLQANSTGWQAAQIQVAPVGNFSFSPSGTVRLDVNLEDLRPRNHIYVTAGLDTLPASFSFDSALQSDGAHELFAVAYEGSHVRTQTRATLPVAIQNLDWSATLDIRFGGSNTVPDALLSFQVTANAPAVSQIELFTTGGSAGIVTGQTNATFNVPGQDLGPGLHPFYAVVTAVGGQQVRTETRMIRLTSAIPLFPVLITAPPPVLKWAAVAGRTYEILSTTNLSIPFGTTAMVVPESSLGQWTDPSPPGPHFYQVRALP